MAMIDMARTAENVHICAALSLRHDGDIQFRYMHVEGMKFGRMLLLLSLACCCHMLAAVTHGQKHDCKHMPAIQVADTHTAIACMAPD